MIDRAIPVGRVLRFQHDQFHHRTKTLAADVPRFGAFVVAAAPDGGTVIGLVYDVLIDDDLFARQLIGADVGRNTSPISGRTARCRSRSVCWSWDMRATARCINICPRSRPSHWMRS